MRMSLRESKGLTLTEVLVALVVSAILIAALYRTFIGQQKTYTVQEQVVDMQQNARLAINRMMKEMRMAGFGNVGMILPSATFGSKTLSNAINANNPGAGVTVITVGESTTLAVEPTASNQIQVTSLTDSQGNALFDTGNRKYVSVDGLESFQITNVDTGNKILTLNGNLTQGPKQNAPVFALRAVSYQVDGGTFTLRRDENLGAGEETLIDNITGLQLQYLDESGNVIADPVANAANIRVIRVAVTARTSVSDPDYKSDGGYRMRTITSNINVRNMGLNP
jgi:prepilin-type N-terminal cleavage/methylation domain-containing protein